MPRPLTSSAVEEEDAGCANKPRMLDLFSGTGSVAEVYRQHGFNVTTLDMDPKWGADIQVDVMDWDYESIPPGHYHTVFAAPPCTEYSQAMTCRPRNLAKADKFIRRTLQILQHLKPVKWFMENPATGLLKTRGLLDHVDHIVVDYCRFAPWGYRKPTQIWGSVQGLNNVGCDPEWCPNMTLQQRPWETQPKWRHRVLLEGGAVTLQDKYKIPPRLVEYLAGWGTPPHWTHWLLKSRCSPPTSRSTVSSNTGNRGNTTRQHGVRSVGGQWSTTRGSRVQKEQREHEKWC